MNDVKYVNIYDEWIRHIEGCSTEMTKANELCYVN